jgi:peptidoglycan/xylan/chitin deacetylase (PgdA/CDA1 family)
MRVPVLTYHSMQILGNDYGSNDHCALAEDLELIHSLGLRVVPLRQVVETLVGGAHHDLDGTIAITLDDGPDFDWCDIEHPHYGPQKSMARVLREFRQKYPDDQPTVHATSFVVASPAARAQLDRTCMAGAGWWSDDWWPEAHGSDLIEIANHSWDHNHRTLARTAQRNGVKGCFSVVDNHEDADAQIRQASEYIQRQLGTRDSLLFAYPYGEWSQYLVDEYLPRHPAEHRIEAALTTAATPVENSTNRWLVPRYVFGHDWRSPSDLQRLLKEVG